MRIGLVGCVKSKRIVPESAQNLYTSALFRGRRQYVEGSCDRWFVLSAKHGLVDPLEVIEPYDVALSKQSASYRSVWSRNVLRQLQNQIGDISGLTFEFHAGASYRNSGLSQGLLAMGASVEVPTSGYRLGEHLAFYASGARPSEKTSGASVPKSLLQRRRGRPTLGYDVIGAFLGNADSDDITMTFDQIEVLIGRALPMSASKYGVWWANSATNPQSQGWVSVGWKVHHIKVQDRVVRFRRVKSTPVAVEGAHWSKPAAPTARHSSLSLIQMLRSSDPKPVVDAMLTYGATLAIKRKSDGISYATDPGANKFLVTDPFAFLVGVIFDQGITAERAWTAPYELSLRLGHLDPQRLAIDFQGIRAAVQQRPKLHRFVNNLPEWVALAAEKVVREYGGDASNIWNDKPTALELHRRLVAFKGIGQKKAAMTVELLERDFDVQISELEGSDVAFDVHIRRVFLRAGLGDVDRLDHIVRSGRQHHPERPGSLDGPAWQIGRRWCRPTLPSCSECVLDDVCPKFISRADAVKGV